MHSKALYHTQRDIDLTLDETHDLTSCCLVRFRFMNKATRILTDDTVTHYYSMLHGEYILLPSSRMFRTVTCETNRKRLSFVPMCRFGF